MTVYLVGAGPGDPGLITVKGLELVRSCDALVYDRLVAPELVAEAPSDAIQIDRARLSQAEINDVLLRLGRTGLDVVRLKGGDPFVFGRGGEEALALAEAGVEFEVVPGVSAGSAVPAAAGIPITHRGISSQVTLVAGTTPPSSTSPPWQGWGGRSSSSWAWRRCRRSSMGCSAPGSRPKRRPLSSLAERQPNRRRSLRRWRR